LTVIALTLQNSPLVPAQSFVERVSLGTRCRRSASRDRTDWRWRATRAPSVFAEG